MFYPCDDIFALTMLAWLTRTIQKLGTHLLGVCHIFDAENYLTVSVVNNLFIGVHCCHASLCLFSTACWVVDCYHYRFFDGHGNSYLSFLCWVVGYIY